jgi:hypothetical protein
MAKATWIPIETGMPEIRKEGFPFTPKAIGHIVNWDYPERISSYTLKYDHVRFDDGHGEEVYNKIEYWKNFRKGTFMLWAGDHIPPADDISKQLNIGFGDTEGVMAFLKNEIGLEDTNEQVPIYKNSSS